MLSLKGFLSKRILDAYNKMTLRVAAARQGGLTLGDVLSRVGQFNYVERIVIHDRRQIDEIKQNPVPKKEDIGRQRITSPFDPTVTSMPDPWEDKSFVLGEEFFFTPAGLDPQIYSLNEKVLVIGDSIKFISNMDPPFQYDLRFRLFGELDPLMVAKSVNIWGETPEQSPINVSETLFGT